MMDYDFQLEKLEEIMKTKKDGGVYYRPDRSLQWNFTPGQVFENLPKTILQLKNSLWCVIINVEVCIYLNKLGVPFENITYLADCEEREWLAKAWRIQNIYRMKKVGKRVYITGQENMKNKFNVSFYNSDFKDAREFRKIAEHITKDFTIEIADSKSMLGANDWNQVVEYRYLGSVFKTAQITAVRTIRCLNGTKTKLKIVGDDIQIEIDKVPSFVPGRNIQNYLWADNIIKKGLKTYQAEISSLTYQDAKHSETGTPTICTVSGLQPGDTPMKGWPGGAKRIPDEQLDQTKGLGAHKAVISKTGTIGKFGEVKYAGPEYAVGFGSYFIRGESKDEIMCLINYINSEKVKKLISVVKNATVVNGQAIWSLIPHHSEESKWQ